MLKLDDLLDITHGQENQLSTTVREFDLKGTPFRFNSSPSLMGVINLSSDSWYRESVCLNLEMAIHRGRILKAQGADLIDVGAESTLAQAVRVDDATQKSLMLPVIQGIADQGILVSSETYAPSVAEACLEAGAAVLNLTGVVDSESIYPLVADHDAAVIICYVQGNHVREVGDFDLNEDPIGQMLEYFKREIEKAEKAGVKKMILDAGLGFYYRNLKDSRVRIRYQMATFLTTFRLRQLGWPTCHALPHAFETFGEEVRSAEPFFAVLAALGGTDLLRTHEVAKTKAVLDTMKVW